MDFQLYELYNILMAIKTLRDILIPLITFIAIVSVSAAVIAYGRGYRLDITQKSVKSTGLLAATSDPTGAQILVDGKLKSATNNTLNINPGWFTVTISKEGYQPWEKKLRIQAEVVTRADAYLFPANPSLSALSTSGVFHPRLSPDGSKLAYVIPETPEATSEGTLINRAGIWVLDLVDRPLGFNRDARVIAKSTNIDFSQATLLWTPDSKQLLAAVPGLPNTFSYYLLDTDKPSDFPMRVTDMQVALTDWLTLAKIRDQERLAGIKSNLAPTVSEMMKIISFSPDESKILYEASQSGTIPQIITPPMIGTNPAPETRTIKTGMIYTYDMKEDKNYLLGSAADLGFVKPTPTPRFVQKKTTTLVAQPFADWINTNDFDVNNYLSYTPIMWLPTNRHLIIVTRDHIDAIDYDATNRKTIYAGPFQDSFAVPWVNASKILILTTLNPTNGNLPNLYAVNLR